MKKTIGLMAGAMMFLAACETQVVPDGVLVGKALEDRLMHTELVLRPYNTGKKPRKGAITQIKIKLLPTGESTWTTNGKYPMETLLHWSIKGNTLCIDSPRRQFWDAKRKRQEAELQRKYGKVSNCGVVAIKGDRVTLYAPPSRFSPTRTSALTGVIRKIWP